MTESNEATHDPIEFEDLWNSKAAQLLSILEPEKHDVPSLVFKVLLDDLVRLATSKGRSQTEIREWFDDLLIRLPHLQQYYQYFFGKGAPQDDPEVDPRPGC
jgi:hypothetical protein